MKVKVSDSKSQKDVKVEGRKDVLSIKGDHSLLRKNTVNIFLGYKLDSLYCELVCSVRQCRSTRSVYCGQFI
jgi:hypothetical protein